MKFFADAMLGRLATWMRILGCDVEYASKIGDGELVERARRSGRLILTRDTRLVRRRHAKGFSFLVEGDDYRDQLRQVTRRFGLQPWEKFLTRCLRCNAGLQSVAPSEVKGAVPLYVYDTQEFFEQCPRCRRVYWGATHREKMRAHLEKVLGGRGEKIDSTEE